MRKLKIKRFLIKLSLFFGIVALPIFTFVSGVVATLLWQEFVTPPTVTLCQLAQNPSWYKWRTVRVEADGRGSFGAVIILDETCRLPDAWAGVWLAENYKPEAEANKLFTESDSDAYKARVLVTGRFNPDATLGCFGPKAAIRATSVELKSEITTESLKKRTEE